MQDQLEESEAKSENSDLFYAGNRENLIRATVIVIAASCLSFGFGAFAYTQRRQVQTTVHKEKTNKMQAKGTFEVQVKPLAHEDSSADAMLGRMSLDKQFQGDLQGIGKGQMLTAGTAVKDSAGYVAIERVSGTLNGRKGSFTLQHSGTMTHGEFQLNISVVPDSGTEELTGISGRFMITITEGKHFYDFEYSLSKAP
jgi:hypothetical protein